VLSIGGFLITVHHLAYVLWVGEVPRGKGLGHDPEKCVQLGILGRACFNPSHVRPCDRKTNEADKRRGAER